MTCYRCSALNRPEARRCAHCGAILQWKDWVITKELGAGGMGVAYLARLGTQVAVLKVPAYTALPRAQHMVECRNLYLAASLGVTPMPIETSPDGILMEYFAPVQTVSLRDRIVSLLRNINILHNRGFVVVDLKPDNVIVTAQGSKLIDLGSMVDSLRDRVTDVYATPGYAAPEVYRNEVTPLGDAYAAGWCIVQMLGGPEPDSQTFGPPAGMMHSHPYPWDDLVCQMLAPEIHRRLSVGMAYHRLVAPVIQTNGIRMGADLVTVHDWIRAGMPDNSCASLAGYVVNARGSSMDDYCQRTGSRLPTLAELQALAVGTELQQATRSVDQEPLISDVGARHCRRYVWQPTSDGYLFGGTTHVDRDQMAGSPGFGNMSIGLRVVHG